MIPKSIKIFLSFFAVISMSSMAQAAWPYLGNWGQPNFNRDSNILTVTGEYTYTKADGTDHNIKKFEIARQQRKTCNNFARGWKPGNGNGLVVVGIIAPEITANESAPGASIFTGTFTFQCRVRVI